MVVVDIFYVYRCIREYLNWRHPFVSNKANLTYIPRIPLEHFNENR